MKKEMIVLFVFSEGVKLGPHVLEGKIKMTQYIMSIVDLYDRVFTARCEHATSLNNKSKKASERGIPLRVFYI